MHHAPCANAAQALALTTGAVGCMVGGAGWPAHPRPDVSNERSVNWVCASISQSTSSAHLNLLRVLHLEEGAPACRASEPSLNPSRSPEVHKFIPNALYRLPGLNSTLFTLG